MFGIKKSEKKLDAELVKGISEASDAIRKTGISLTDAPAPVNNDLVKRNIEHMGRYLDELRVRRSGLEIDLEDKQRQLDDINTVIKHLVNAYDGLRAERGDDDVTNKIPLNDDEFINELDKNLAKKKS